MAGSEFEDGTASAALLRREGEAIVAISTEAGLLAQRLQALLDGLPRQGVEFPFDLDTLSLRLGRRLPDQARTMTYWQRGERGRALRAAGFGVEVQLERIIFVRRAAARGSGGAV